MMINRMISLTFSSFAPSKVGEKVNSDKSPISERKAAIKAPCPDVKASRGSSTGCKRTRRHWLRASAVSLASPPQQTRRASWQDERLEGEGRNWACLSKHNTMLLLGTTNADAASPPCQAQMHRRKFLYPLQWFVMAAGGANFTSHHQAPSL